MDDKFYNLIRTVFRTKLAKPTNAQELVEFYGALVKSATCRKFVNVSKGQIKINTDYVAEHLELNEFKNPNRNGFSAQAQKHFELPTQEVQDIVGGGDFGLDD